jgi:hypothetical protein
MKFYKILQIGDICVDELTKTCEPSHYSNYAINFLFMLFLFLATEKTNKEVHRLPSPSSGFHSSEDGIISKIDSTKEKSGIFCQNDAHYGAVENVTVIEEHCDPCVEYGAPLKTTHDCWSLQEDLPPIITSEDDLQPKFLLALVSRTSNGCAIPQKVFDELRQFINNLTTGAQACEVHKRVRCTSV